MDDLTIIRQLSDAVDQGDVAAVRDLLTHYPDLLKDGVVSINDFLRDAARRDNVDMMSLLVEFGADIHAPDGYGDPPAPEGVIYTAAGNGAINVVRWLLDHGAKVNYHVEGITRCFPLTAAVIGGHLDVVKLLVEHGGADINAVWRGQNALSCSIMYGQKEIEAYLRFKGAREPWQLAGEKPRGADTILEHVEKHLGKPQPLSLQEIVADDPPITIYVVPMANAVALVTTGMSDRPMTVPEGGEDYRFAELVMYLPPDWPLTAEALRNPNTCWPIGWLRRIARYPHENNTWLGGPAVVLANDEPPKPLAPNTQLTCLLALTEASEFGCLHLQDGKRVVFYTLYPLYTDERDLEKEKGTEHLLRVFQKHKISRIVDVHRQSVALDDR
jgi:hypothetical protein